VHLLADGFSLEEADGCIDQETVLLVRQVTQSCAQRGNRLGFAVVVRKAERHADHPALPGLA
jgi:hypothetical protein